MDNSIINIRILDWHFQVERWRRGWKPKLVRNSYHRVRGWPDGYVKIYRLFNYVA